MRLEKELLVKKLFVHNHNQIYYDNPARPVSDLEKNKRV